MSRNELWANELSSSQKTKLFAHGYRTIRDFDGVTSAVLVKDTGITAEDAAEILGLIRGKLPHKTALQLYDEGVSRVKITTMCKGIDDLLGGGIPLGQVTEFVGVPGVGKTQICMQLCASVSIPAAFGGAEGEAIYIDTEGSFVPDRAEDIALALSRTLEASGVFLTEKDVLSRIHYYRVHGIVEQIAMGHAIAGILRANHNIRLVVLDSVAFHLRYVLSEGGGGSGEYGSSATATRTRVLASLSQQLMAAAQEHRVAVVLTNQVTTRIESNGASKMVPALGEVWGHACTNRIFLHHKQGSGDVRSADLFKSPSFPCKSADYVVTTDGIRDFIM